jgi:hypothetical protein
MLKPNMYDTNSYIWQGFVMSMSQFIFFEDTKHW